VVNNEFQSNQIGAKATTNEISPEIQSGTISGKFTGNTTQNRQRQKKTGTYLPATPVEVNSCLNFQ